LQKYQQSVLIINKEILERIERAKRFNYHEDKIDADSEDKGDDGQPRNACQYTQIIIDLGEAGLNPENFEYYEAFRIAEDIRCNKLKKNIFESLGYVDKKTTVNVNGVSMSYKKIVTKDVSGSDYSIHLVEILEDVHNRIDSQKS